MEQSAVSTYGSPIGLGWFILIAVLVGVIVLLLMLWVFGVTTAQKCVQTTPWGVIPDTAGTALTNCGPNRDQICTFPVLSLGGAINQCEQLQCSAFMYNELLVQMTIVDPTAPRTSTPQVDLFIKNRF